jgi:hypothetical protein
MACSPMTQPRFRQVVSRVDGGWKSPTYTQAIFWVIERPVSLVSRDRVSRGGAIPLGEGDLRHLTLSSLCDDRPNAGHVTGHHIEERDGTYRKKISDKKTKRRKRGGGLFFLYSEKRLSEPFTIRRLTRGASGADVPSPGPTGQTRLSFSFPLNSLFSFFPTPYFSYPPHHFFFPPS